MALTLPLDLAMASPATNRVVDEPHLIDTAESRFFVPQGGPFFALGIELKIGSTLLMPGVHYQILHMYEEATLASGKEVDAIVYIKDTPQTPLGSTVLLTCHYVGGPYSATTDALQQILDNLTLPGAATLGWGSVLNKPVQYPPAAHLHHIRNIFGTDEMVTVLEGVRQAILQGDQGTINALYQYIDLKIAQLGNTMAAAYAATQAIQTAIATHQAASNAHTKAQVGLGNVGNYAMANEAQSIEGVAWNLYTSPAGVAAYVAAQLGVKASLEEARAGTDDAKLMTSLKVAEAIRNGKGGAGVAQNPDTTLMPTFFIQSNDHPSLDALPRNRVFRIETYFRSLVDGAITAASQRKQEAYDIQGGVVWTRDFNGTSWSAWTPRSLDFLQNIYSNINDGVIATYPGGDAHLDVNAGLIAGIYAIPRSTTVGGVTTIYTPEYHLFLGRVGEHAFRGINGTVDPTTDAYFDPLCSRPSVLPDSVSVTMTDMQILSYDPGLNNSPATMLMYWRNGNANSTEVNSVLQAGTVRLGPTKSATPRRLIRVTGSFTIASMTVQKDPGCGQRSNSQNFGNRLASLGDDRAAGISAMLVLANNTQLERRIMFLRTQSATAPDDVRFGLGITSGTLTSPIAADVLLDDADITSTAVPIATQSTTTRPTSQVLTDSTAFFHGLVEATGQSVSGNAECKISVFRPHWNAANSNGEATLSSVKTTSMSVSLAVNGWVMAMCMFECPVSPAPASGEVRAHLAILTKDGKLMIWRVSATGTANPTFTSIATISLFQHVPEYTLSTSSWIRYIGGCFHISTNTNPRSYIVPWVPAFGNTLPLPIRGSNRVAAPVAYGNHYYDISNHMLRMGRINFTDDEFF